MFDSAGEASFFNMLSTIEVLTRAMLKKLTQGMSDHNKDMAAAKTDEERNIVKVQKQNATAGLRSCNNILTMAQPLHSKIPAFIGDEKINLSWKEAAKPSSRSTAAVTGEKRAAATAGNGSGAYPNKKGRGAGFAQNQLVNRALEGVRGVGGGRTGGRGRGWRGHGRGRGYRY